MVPEYELEDVRQIGEDSYRMIYLIKEAENGIEVLALVHTARKRLDLLE
jgi:hypothetical protein